MCFERREPIQTRAPTSLRCVFSPDSGSQNPNPDLGLTVWPAGKKNREKRKIKKSGNGEGQRRWMEMEEMAGNSDAAIVTKSSVLTSRATAGY